MESLQPPLVPEESLVKGSKKTVYLMRNGLLHSFPNADTFLGMGYDFKNVKLLSDQLLKKITIGDPLSTV